MENGKWKMENVRETYVIPSSEAIWIYVIAGGNHTISVEATWESPKV